MKCLIALLTTIIFLVSVQASSIPIFQKEFEDESVSERNKSSPYLDMRAQERLIKTLLENYVKSVKPEPSNGSPLQLYIKLLLNNLDHVDTNERIIETHSYLLMSWIDERLSWDPSNFHQVGMLHMPSESLWIPDIVLKNNDGDDQKPMTDNRAIVFSNGSVIYVPQLHLKSWCEADKQPTEVVKKFSLPRYEELVCELKFGSYTYDKHEINLVSLSSHIDLSEFRRFPADKFQVKSTSVKVVQKFYKCCHYSFQTATFTIVLSNNPKYYYDTANERRK